MRHLLIILFLCLSLIASGTNYYVASTGNDASADPTNPATPWKTISKVNSYWAALNFAPGDRILFNRGDVFFGGLSPSEGGTAGSPIVIGAYGTGANPVITGLETVSSWTLYKPNIYYTVIDVEGTIDLEMVLVDGEQKAMGRYPDAGSYNYIDARDLHTYIYDAALPASPTYVGGELFFLKNVGFPTLNVINDQGGDTIYYTEYTSYGNPPAVGYGYFIQEHYNTLTSNFEWYYDGDTLFMFFGSLTPGDYTVQVATVDNLVDYSNFKNYLTFENINFYGANQNAVYAYSQDYITVQNCNIEYIGSYGVRVRNSDYNTIDNCTISHCNEVGIFSNSNSHYTTVKNNLVRDIGLIVGSGYQPGGVGIVATQGNGQIIENNQVRNVTSAGINFNGENAEVRYNIVDTFALHFRDEAGIYITSNVTPGYIYNNRSIHHNMVFNGVGGSVGYYSGAANDFALGIYIDIGEDKGVKIYNNTVAHCSGAGQLLSCCQNVDVHDNVYFNTGEGLQIQDGVGVPGDPSNLELSNLNVTRNKFVAKTPAQILIWNRSDSVKQNTYGTLDSNYYARPIKDNGNFVYKYSDIDGADSLTFADWKTYSSLEAHSLNSPVAVTSTNDIYFYYNASSVNDSTIVIPMPMMDIEGKEYGSLVTLDAWESIVLLKNPSPPTTTFAVDKNGNLMKDKNGNFTKVE